MNIMSISKGVIPIENQDKKKRIDYDIEEILSEFADQKNGMSSLAEKYKTRIGRLPSVDSERKRAENEDALPEGHRLVYEDRSQAKGQDDFSAKKSEKSHKPLPEGVRVVFDADEQNKLDSDSFGEFNSFDDIPFVNKSGSKNMGKSADRSRPAPSRNSAYAPPVKTEQPLYDDGFQSFDDISPSTLGLERGRYGGQQDEGGQSGFSKFISGFVPQKGDGRGEVLRKLVLSLSVVIFIVAVSMIIANLTDTKAVVPPAVDEISTDEQGNYIDPRDSYPDIDFPEGLHDRFVHYYALNQDFVGQIVIKTNNRQVEEPVVYEKNKPQGAEDYYLKRNFFKEPSSYGTPYMDSRNDTGANDTNTILYGHNMKDGAQFAIIEDYIYEANGLKNLKEYPTITYWTQSEKRTYLIYALMITNGRGKDDNGYVFAYHTPKFMNEEAFLGYKRMLDMKNLYDTGIDLNFNDKLITISTCGYTFKDAWYVLVARELREGETPEMYTSTYKRRNESDVWFPQSWYNSKSKTNTFVDESKWYEY